MLLRLRAAFRKEFVQFFQDRMLIVLVIWLFVDIANDGFTMSLDVRNLALLVIDHDNTSISRALGERFRIAPYFVYARTTGPADPETTIERGAGLVLVIPPGFARALDRGESVPVQLLANGTFSNISVLALGYAADIVQAFNADVRVEWAARGGRPLAVPSIVHHVRVWYLPALNDSQALAVMQIGMVVLMVGVLLPAAGIVREKEAGTLEQLLVTPLRAWELIVAKLVPMGVVIMLGLLIALAEVTLLFGVPLRGSLGLFVALSLLMLFTSMGLGACIGAVARNLQQTLLLTFALLFPMFFLSGTFVPVDEMPPVMQWLTVLSPLRWYVPVSEGILFKAVDLSVLAPNALILGAYGALLMALGVWQLRRTLAG